MIPSPPLPNPPKSRVTPAMSIRFGAFFGQPVLRSLGEGGSEDFWHSLQVECDFRALANDRKKLTSSVKPAKQLNPAI